MAKPTFILLWHAIVQRAHARCPGADVFGYMSLNPAPTAPWPEGADKPPHKPVDGWHPFERPRKNENDLAWIWLEAARGEVRQALVDGQLIAIHRQLDGVRVVLPKEGWRNPATAEDLRLCKPEWLAQGEALELDMAEFKAWLVLCGLRPALAKVPNAPVTPPPAAPPKPWAAREKEYADYIQATKEGGGRTSGEQDRGWGKERGVNRGRISQWRVIYVKKEWDWSKPGPR